MADESTKTMTGEVEVRNPSPPPQGETEGLAEEATSGGGIQETFILRLLIDVVEYVDKEEEHESEEINPDIEERLCQLWDMTCTEDVGKFLIDSDFIEISSLLVMNTNKPRLAELLMGVWSNLLSLGGCAQTLSASKFSAQLAPVLTSALCWRDIPTLVVATRAMKLLLEGDLWSECWERELKEKDNWKDLAFFLQNSTNNDILLNVAQVVDKLLEEGVSQYLKGTIFVSSDAGPRWTCVLEAIDQSISAANVAAVAALAHILSTLSTLKGGTNAIELEKKRIENSLEKMMRFVCDSSDTVGPMEASVVVSSIPLFRIILDNKFTLREQLRVFASKLEESKETGLEEYRTFINAQIVFT